MEQDVTIVVVGSLNMDFVVQVSRLPERGETVAGHGFRTLPGGKGANQACAVGRLGGRCRMVGRVGADVFGQQLVASLAAAGVDTRGVLATAGEATGVALIPVEVGGQNQIVVAGGANLRLSVADVEVSLAEVVGGALLVQLESPLETVSGALASGRRAGMVTILDPAPARWLPDTVLSQVEILTPNETEALALLGRTGSVTMAEAPSLAAALRARGARSVILKLGAQGAWLSDADGRHRHFAAPGVEAIDATAAGDTFNGALAVALMEGRPIEEAIGFANAAAALSVTRLGAQASIPSRGEVEDLLGRQSGRLAMASGAT